MGLRGEMMGANEGKGRQTEGDENFQKCFSGCLETFWRLYVNVGLSMMFKDTDFFMPWVKFELGRVKSSSI